MTLWLMMLDEGGREPRQRSGDFASVTSNCERNCVDAVFHIHDEISVCILRTWLQFQPCVTVVFFSFCVVHITLSWGFTATPAPVISVVDHWSR